MTGSPKLLRKRQKVDYTPPSLNTKPTSKEVKNSVKKPGRETDAGISPNHRDKVVTEDGRVFFPCPYCSRAFSDNVKRAIHLNSCPAKSYILSVDEMNVSRTPITDGAKKVLQTSQITDSQDNILELQSDKAIALALDDNKVSGQAEDNLTFEKVTDTDFSDEMLTNGDIVDVSGYNNLPQESSLNSIFPTDSEESDVAPTHKISTVAKFKLTHSKQKREKISKKPTTKKAAVKKPRRIISGNTEATKSNNEATKSNKNVPLDATDINPLEQQLQQQLPTINTPNEELKQKTVKKPNIKIIKSEIIVPKAKPAPKRRRSKSIVITPSIDMTSLEQKIADLVNMISGDSKSTASKVSIKKDEKTGSLVISTGPEITKSKAGANRSLPEKSVSAKKKKNNEPSQIIKADIDSAGPKRSLPENSVSAKKKKNNEPSQVNKADIDSAGEQNIEIISDTTAKGDESDVVINAHVAKKTKKQTNKTVKKQVNKVVDSLKKQTKKVAVKSKAKIVPKSTGTSTMTNSPLKMIIKNNIIVSNSHGDDNLNNNASMNNGSEGTKTIVNENNEKINGKRKGITEKKSKVANKGKKVVEKVNETESTSTENGSTNKIKDNDAIKVTVDENKKMVSGKSRAIKMNKVNGTHKNKKSAEKVQQKITKPKNSRVNKRQLKKQVNQVILSSINEVLDSQPDTGVDDSGNVPTQLAEVDELKELPTGKKIITIMDNVILQEKQKTKVVAETDVMLRGASVKQLKSKSAKNENIKNMGQNSTNYNSINKVDSSIIPAIVSNVSTQPQNMPIDINMKNIVREKDTEKIKKVTNEELTKSFENFKAKQAKRSQRLNVQKEKGRRTKLTKNIKSTQEEFVLTEENPQSSHQLYPEKITFSEEHVSNYTDTTAEYDTNEYVDIEVIENEETKLETINDSHKPFLTDEELLSILALRDDVQVECIIRKPIVQNVKNIQPKISKPTQFKSINKESSLKTSSLSAMKLNKAMNSVDQSDVVISPNKIARKSSIREMILNNYPRDDMHPNKLKKCLMEIATSSVQKIMNSNNESSIQQNSIRKLSIGDQIINIGNDRGDTHLKKLKKYPEAITKSSLQKVNDSYDQYDQSIIQQSPNIGNQIPNIGNHDLSITDKTSINPNDISREELEKEFHESDDKFEEVEEEYESEDMESLLLKDDEEEKAVDIMPQASSSSTDSTTSSASCKYCNMEFANAIDMLRHRRQAHNFPKILVSASKLEEYLQTDDFSRCPICQKPLKLKPYPSSQNKWIYTKHLRTHCVEMNYSCSICHRKFRRRDNMKEHERRHIVCKKDD